MSTVTCEECKNVRQGNWLKVTLKQVDLDLGSGITLFYVIMCKILGRNQKRSIDLIMIFNKARGIFHLWYHFKICLLHLWEHIKSFTCFCTRLSFVYWVHISLYFYVVDITDIWTIFGFVTPSHRGKAPATQSDVRGTQERQRELGTPRGHCCRTHW